MCIVLAGRNAYVQGWRREANHHWAVQGGGARQLTMRLCRYLPKIGTNRYCRGGNVYSIQPKRACFFVDSVVYPFERACSLLLLPDTFDSV